MAENAAVLAEHTEINNHAIKLVEEIQLPFESMYSIRRVDLDTLKMYIKINLANKFIWPFKSLTDASILFDWKRDCNFRLYVDY